MTVPDGGLPPAGDDVLEMGSRRGPVLRWRPPMAALVLAAMALLVGLAVGYAAGQAGQQRHGRPGSGGRRRPPPQDRPAPTAHLQDIVTSRGPATVRNGHSVNLFIGRLTLRVRRGSFGWMKTAR